MKRRSPSEASDIEKRAKITNACCVAKSSESVALQNIVGEPVASFFQDIYQRKAHLYHVDKSNVSSTELASIYLMGCDDLASMLQASKTYLHRFSTEVDIDPSILPLIFRNKKVLQPDEVRDEYGNNPFAAYLDGCSIVNNHADLISPQMASLCLDLQKSLPHVYINTYLTPPKSAAVKAHADDRDVFVIQIIGEKRWKVYEEVPIEYPYDNEQVGKGNLPIPGSVFKKNPMLDITLKPGDVLYMPRGCVHEAFTEQHLLSFHATVAIATHDWSLSKTISSIVRHRLDQVPDFRMAVHPHIGTRNLAQTDRIVKDELSGALKRSVELIKSCVSLESIADHLEKRYGLHNDHVQGKRIDLIYKKRKRSITCVAKLVGPEASEAVIFESKNRFRASTSEERASAPPPVARHGRGLTVRQETCDVLLSILSALRNEDKTCTLNEIRDDMKKRKKHGEMLCDLTLLCFVRCCVELGAMAVITTPTATVSDSLSVTHVQVRDIKHQP